MRLVAASCLVHPKIALAPVQTVWGKGNDPLAAIPATKPKIQSITRAPKEVRTLRGLRDKEAEEVAPIIQTPELELQVLVKLENLAIFTQMYISAEDILSQMCFLVAALLRRHGRRWFLSCKQQWFSRFTVFKNQKGGGSIVFHGP